MIPELEGGNDGDVDGMGELVLYLGSGFTRSNALVVSILRFEDPESDFSGVVFFV